jgi:hypothetical protein
MLAPEPLRLLRPNTGRTSGWHKRDVHTDADVVAFCTLVGRAGALAELTQCVRAIVASLRSRCTLYAIRSLSKRELAHAADGECHADTALPLRLFVSAPAKGNRGMHTVMAVAKFNHEKRARVVASTASTAALNERCATHQRSLHECVATRVGLRGLGARGRGQRGPKVGCDADKVCVAHEASKNALVSRAACASCIRRRATRASSKRPPWLHDNAFFVPRRLIPDTAAAFAKKGPDVCVRRAILHTLGAKAYCATDRDGDRDGDGDGDGDALCAWHIDGPTLSQRRKRPPSASSARAASAASAARAASALPSRTESAARRPSGPNGPSGPSGLNGPSGPTRAARTPSTAALMLGSMLRS